MSWFTMLALRRLRTQWQSLTTLIIGVILAATIGANASLYNTAIAQVGMSQFLDEQDSSDIHIYSRISQSPEETDDFAGTWQQLDQAWLGEFETAFTRESWAGQPIQWAETQALIPIRDNADIEDTRLRIAYYQNLDEHIEIIIGQGLNAATHEISPMQVIIDEANATELNLSVGDIIELDQRGWESSQIFPIEIIGIFRVLDASDEYWFEPSPIRDRGLPSTPLEANLFTTRQTIEEEIPQFLPRPPMQMGWRIAFAHEALPYTEIDDTITNIETFDDNLNRVFLADANAQGSFFYDTSLPTLLSEYQNEIVFLNVPFSLLSLQLAALILFFLILIAALVRRGERREISMLQSRGAEDRQIIIVRAIEALVICGISALIAPFIAKQLLVWFIPVFTGIQQTVVLQITPQVFLYSSIAGILAMFLLITTLLPVLQLPLINAGGVGLRSQQQTWWQRYYLDVVLLIVGIAALFQLTNEQSLVTDTSGEAQADPLLLLAPSLLFIAFSSVLLRFFPVVMNIASRFFTSRRSAEGAIASWQVSREPLHYGRIAFLLALAIGIGWFAISYQGTLLGNQNAQASYLIGTDIRILYNSPQSPEVQESIRRISQLPDVELAIPATRIEVRSMTIGGGGRRSLQGGEILAIDDTNLSNMLIWNDDLGNLSVPKSPDDIPTPIGETIPEDTKTVRFWAQGQGKLYITFGQYTHEFRVYPNLITADGTFTLQLIDANEQLHSLTLTPDRTDLSAFFEELRANSDNPDEFNPYEAFDTNGDTFVDDILDYDYPNNGWLEFTGELSELPETVTYPIRVIGYRVSTNGFFVEESRIQLTELQLTNEDGDTTFVDWLQRDNWDTQRFQNTEGASNFTITRAPESVPIDYDDDILMVQWFHGNENSAFRLLINYPKIADVQLTSSDLDARNAVGLPILASQAFMELNEFEGNQRFNLFINSISPWFQVQDVTTYYPTLFPQQRPYIVVDHDALNYVFGRTINNPLHHNELWLKLNPDVDQRAFAQSLRESADVELFDTLLSRVEVIDSYGADVLALGVIGLLFISFFVGLALSVVSLFTYISLTVQSRMSEFAVLRALGLPAYRLILIILIEQLLVLIAAIGLGIVIGQFLTTQILPPLAQTAAGGNVTPPFVIIVDYVAVAQYLIGIVAVLLSVLAISAFWMRRMATPKALRFSEE